MKNCQEPKCSKVRGFPHLWSIFLKPRRQEYTMGKRQSLQQVVLGKLGSHMQVNLEHTLTLYTKINSKWLKDLNKRHNIIKLLEKNISKTFSEVNHTNVFLGQSPKAIEIKAKIMWDLIKLRNFCTAKETINKMKRQPTEQRKIFANDGNDKGLHFQNIRTVHTKYQKSKQPKQKNEQKT